MQRVFSGIPDAKTIKEYFAKPSSRRVYLYLKSDTQVPSQHSTSVANIASGSGSADSGPLVTQANPTPPVTQANPIPPVIQPNRTPPVTQPNTTPPMTQSNPTPPSIQPNPTPPVTQPNTIPPVAQSNPTPPVAQSNPTSPTTQLNPTHPVTQPNPTPPVPRRDPTHQVTLSGSSTSRRTNSPGTQQPLVHVNVESDDEDNGLLHSPFDGNIVEIEPVQQQDHPSPIEETPETTGVLQEDLSPLGITDATKGKVPLSKIDRVHEVMICEKDLMDGNVYKPLPVLLNLPFDEMCQQGKADECMMVCVVLKEGDDLNPVRRLLSLLGNSKEVIYFWIAKSGTKSARQVTDKFGSNTPKTEIFVLAPASARPVLVERYSGETLRNVKVQELENVIREGQNSIEGLRNERERKNMRKEQDEQFQESLLIDRKNAEQDTGVNASDVSDQGNQQPMQDVTDITKTVQCNSQEKEEKIRKVRLQRVIQEEPTQGHSVRVRTPNGIISRSFGLASHYQEVYDWVGSQKNMPLYFTLHRGDAVVLHQDQILADQTVNLTERDEQEVTQLLLDQVSFKGNYPGHKDLSDTIVDEGQRKLGPDNVENEEKEKKEKEERKEENDDGDAKKKRKRKDNRTSKERRKKQKDESK